MEFSRQETTQVLNKSKTLTNLGQVNPEIALIEH